MMNPLDVVFAPSRLFRCLRERPSWVVSFTALAMISMVIEWFTFYPGLETVLGKLPERATSEMIQDTIHHLGERRGVNVAFVPIKLGVPIAIFSFVLYLVCSVSKPVSLPDWKYFLAVTVWSSWIPVIDKGLALLTQTVAGVVNPTTGLAFTQPLGLGMVRLSSRDPALPYALNALNVFSVWYLVLLSLGISLLCGFPRMKALATVSAVWLLGLFVSAALLRFAIVGVQ